MHIEIAERLNPFIHLSGAFVQLPLSTLSLQVFPARIEVTDLSLFPSKKLYAVDLSLTGPLDEFTVQQDLEKGEICVFGKKGKDYIRYRIAPLKKTHSIALIFEKIPTYELHVVSNFNPTPKIIVKGDVIVIGDADASDKQDFPHIDRLSLGNHKGQDFELIKRRIDFTEIFPLWHRLGQLVGEHQKIEALGNLALLNECKDAIAANAPEKILYSFKKLFLAGFQGLLSPRLIDHDHQGIETKPLDTKTSPSPLLLLEEGAKLIRSLFVQESEDIIHLLPSLPPEFHSGRLLNVKCAKGFLSLEWTKKAIRRGSFHALESGELTLKCSSHEKSYRLRHSSKDKGQRYNVTDAITLIPGKNYWFDNFER